MGLKIPKRYCCAAAAGQTDGQTPDRRLTLSTVYAVSNTHRMKSVGKQHSADV